MPIAKAIPKPLNWQDFERLCKKIFGEVWGCPNTIKLNGRQGQEQHGVDIYGIPKDESKYWGVQCKGKDDYTNASLREDEIDREIKKAKRFQPQLATFIFATTANKDSKIEEYIRKRDEESRQSGSFSIILYCWEDLTDLIEEHRAVYDWWVKEKRHRELYDFSVTFCDKSTETTIHPKFRKITYNHIAQVPGQLPISSEVSQIIKNISLFSNYAASIKRESPQRSLSLCEIEIFLENTGREVIEDYKVEFHIDGAFQKITDEPIEDDWRTILSASHEKHRSFFIWEDSFMYKPHDRDPLTQEDSRYINLYLLPEPKKYHLKIKWKLYARDFTKVGELTINVIPDYEEVVRPTTGSSTSTDPAKVEFQEVFESPSDD